MNISTLLVEKYARVGDVWRARYKSVKLHTPTYTDHYPFLRYPEDLPKFLSRDEVADFSEQYAKTMDLNILMNTNVTSIKYNKEKRGYHVEADTPKGPKTFFPQHVVLAMGTFSERPIIPDFPGQHTFKGQVYHSSKHISPNEILNVQSKKVVVIGAGTSAHDIAQVFVLAGAAKVSMIQRSPIFSISLKSFENVLLALWNTPGLSTEEADIIANSTPLAVIRAWSISMTQAMAAQDKEMIEGLKKAGVALRTGEDGYGIADYQLIKGGHFYIDQGANEMIIDGRIKVHRCEDGIKTFTEKGITLANDAEVDADVVVLATGFKLNNTNVAQFLGDNVAEKMEAFGLLDSEQERGGWWRPTGAPGFWYTTGSFLWSRQFSLPLALQIAAVCRGLNEGYYETQTLLD